MVSFVQAAAVAAVLDCQLLLAAVLYTLAFNHKHMLLYFAPAFFSTLLGACFSSVRSRKATSASSKSGQVPLHIGITKVLQLGFTVVATCAAVWAPFLVDPSVAMQACTP
jgi:alpha-1,3-glucosyltransferase